MLSPNFDNISSYGDRINVLPKSGITVHMKASIAAEDTTIRSRISDSLLSARRRSSNAPSMQCDYGDVNPHIEELVGETKLSVPLGRMSRKISTLIGTSSEVL